jgi:hypothetical protein
VNIGGVFGASRNQAVAVVEPERVSIREPLMRATMYDQAGLGAYFCLLAVMGLQPSGG